MNIPSFIASSVNPENISLFVKSLVTFAVLFGLDSTVADQAGSFATSLILGIGMVISAVTGIWGLVRKITLGRWSATPSDTYHN